jgi:type III secretory pathway component EscS
MEVGKILGLAEPWDKSLCFMCALLCVLLCLSILVDLICTSMLIFGISCS